MQADARATPRMQPVKPRWLQEIESGLTQLDDEVRRRRNVSTVDPVADGIAYAASELKTRVGTLIAPGRELTPAEWGAEQDPPVVEQTVRNWIKAGELEARMTSHGYRVLATAVRAKRTAGGSDAAA